MQPGPEQGAPPEAAPEASGPEQMLGQIDGAMGALAEALAQAGAPDELVQEGAALKAAFAEFAQKIVGGGGDPMAPEPQPVEQAGGAVPMTPRG